MHRLKAQGFKGIKLHPEYQQFYVDDPRLEPLYQELAGLNLAVLFHAGVDYGVPVPVHGEPRRLAQVLPLLERCTTIIAHMGEIDRVDDVLDMLCGTNVYFDTAYTLGRMELEDARHIIRKHTPERILFGTDSPWTHQGRALKYFLQKLAPGFLSTQDTRKVLWHNGARLLGLES